MMSKKPLLSIGMIVKNEMRCLERCFHSLAPLREALPCQLVVADTGSVDGSRELVKKYADICFDFQWINDFAAARNAVLERCNGEWFLFLDADEWLDQNISELVQFIRSGNRKISFATIPLRNYLSPDMLGDYTDFPALRLMRMSDDIRFVGSIHEHLEIKNGQSWGHLSKTMIYHDGYAHETREEAVQKSIRNMEMLEAEIEKEPQNLMRLLQCMDSASSLPEKAAKFARQSMDLVMNNHEVPLWDVMAPNIAARAANLAANYHLPERKEWIDWGKEHFPAAPSVEVDIAYEDLLWLFGQMQYTEAIEAAKRYLAGLKKYHEGRYAVIYFTYSTLYNVGTSQEQAAGIMLGMALTKTGRKSEAVNILTQIDLSEAKPKFAVSWLDAMEALADMPEAVHAASRIIPEITEFREGDPERSRSRRKACFSRIAASFLPGVEIAGGWRLYLEIPGVFGDSARLMAEHKEDQAEKIMAGITEWGAVPPPVLAHVISAGLKFPGEFYQQSPEYLREIAVSLPKYDADYNEKIVSWPMDAEKLQALQFRFECLAAALRSPRFANTPQKEELCYQFSEISAMYLTRLYHPQILAQESEVNALPGLHRFAWHIIHAVEAEQDKDWASAVAALRAALEDAPAMKQTVDFLLDKVSEESQSSNELLALAEQVRIMLSVYAPDDPAVAELKSSPAYQKVARLIEGPEVFGGLAQ